MKSEAETQTELTRARVRVDDVVDVVELTVLTVLTMTSRKQNQKHRLGDHHVHSTLQLVGFHLVSLVVLANVAKSCEEATQVPSSAFRVSPRHHRVWNVAIPQRHLQTAHGITELGRANDAFKPLSRGRADTVWKLEIRRHVLGKLLGQFRAFNKQAADCLGGENVRERGLLLVGNGEIVISPLEEEPGHVLVLLGRADAGASTSLLGRAWHLSTSSRRRRGSRVRRGLGSRGRGGTVVLLDGLGSKPGVSAYVQPRTHKSGPGGEH